MKNQRYLRGLVIFLSSSMALSIFAGEHLNFPPSIAPVQAVLLSYTHDDSVETKLFPNPRLDLIKDVRKTFPDLDIRISSELSAERLFQINPELKSMVNGIIQLTDMTSIQDPLEFAWDNAGQLKALSFGYDSSETVAKLLPEASLLIVPMQGQSQTEKIKWQSHQKWRWAGGNVEFLPDGTPIMGLNVPKDAVDYYAQASGKEVLQVDTGWDSSGDLDEVFLWTNDPTKRASCILFHLDVVAGAKLLTDQNIEDYKRSEVAEMKALFEKLGAGFDEGEALQHLDANVKTIKASLAQIEDLQDLINLQTAKIMAHPSMKACREVALPIIYAADLGNYPQGGDFGMQFNNQINSLVIENQAFMLKADFPAQQKAIEQIYAENGFMVHAFSAKGFDGGGGNMHCSTNTVRILQKGGEK